MRNRRFLILLLLLFGLLALAGASQGQDDAQCPALVERALTEIGSNCDAIDRNNACYGYNRVVTAFFEPQPEDFFASPADRSALSLMQSIQTAPLNSQSDEWGVALMNVQANVPGSLPGQAAVFMLFGDVEVENAVDPADAFEPAEPVTVTALATANGRSGPGTNYNVLVGVPNGTVMSADGLNSDGTWVRVLFEERPVWMSRDLVRPDVQGALNNLPVLSSNARTPMQAIHLRAGFGTTECMNAPSTLVIQGPETVRVNINVNGADIQIGSTIALFITPDNFLQLVTLSGVANVAGIQIPPGFTIQFLLTPDGEGMAGPWTGFRTLTPQELNALLWIEDIPSNLLHYPIILPTMGEIMRTRAAIGQPVAPPPDPESTQEPGAESTAEPQPPVAGGACPGFVQTSPLDAASTGPYTFYWDPAPGADTYRWILQDTGGNYLSVIDTQQTNFTYNLPQTFPATLVWAVEALAGGQILCSTDYLTIQLVGGGQEEQPKEDVPLWDITDPDECKDAGGVWDPYEDYCYDPRQFN